MSVLLRHPGRVPALFARSVEPDPREPESASAWRRFLSSAPFAFVATCGLAMVIEIPLVKAAVVAVAQALPG